MSPEELLEVPCTDLSKTFTKDPTKQPKGLNISTQMGKVSSWTKSSPEHSWLALSKSKPRLFRCSLKVRYTRFTVQDAVDDLFADGKMSALEMTATSSFQEVGCTGYRSCLHMPVRTPFTTISSRSTKAALGTCSPPPQKCEHVSQDESIERVAFSTTGRQADLNATSETQRDT